jgi:sec-independent protein translocase protein TatA
MIGTGELLVILGVVTLLFGGKKLPEFARNLGKGVREFKRACAGDEEEGEVIDTAPKNKEE